MAEFDDKLNSLLSDPAAMDQIMRMAQSLMGGLSGGESTPPEGSTAGPPPTANGAWQSQQGGGGNGQPPLGGPGPVQTQGGWGMGQGAVPPWGWMPSGGPFGGPMPGSGPEWNALSGLGSIDPQTIARLLPLLRELGSDRNSNARQLLFALRPYLKPERQDKVERALQLARLFHVGKKFLLKGDRDV